MTKKWLVTVSFDDADAARDYARAVRHAGEVHLPALGTWQTYAADVEVTNHDNAETEYRVLRRLRDHPDAEWKLVITQRGQGRPLRSLPTARGLVTRESKSFWNRDYEYKIQWRPVTPEWRDL